MNLCLPRTEALKVCAAGELVAFQQVMFIGLRWDALGSAFPKIFPLRTRPRRGASTSGRQPLDVNLRITFLSNVLPGNLLVFRKQLELKLAFFLLAKCLTSRTRWTLMRP